MVFIRLMDNSHSAIDIDNQNIIFKKNKIWANNTFSIQTTN